MINEWKREHAKEECFDMVKAAILADIVNGYAYPHNNCEYQEGVKHGYRIVLSAMGVPDDSIEDAMYKCERVRRTANGE